MRFLLSFIFAMIFMMIHAPGNAQVMKGKLWKPPMAPPVPASKDGLDVDGLSIFNLTERLTLRETRPYSGKLSMTGTHFLTQQRTTNEAENYGFVSGDFEYADRKGDFDWSSYALFDVSVEEANEAYFGVPELFARLTDDDSGVKVTIGRQKRKWSELDQRLSLGIWQPQLRWDYLNPVQQGLTGMFFDMDIQTLHVTLFASPVFIPDQGPQFKLNDGRFESPNRWFWQPQTRLRLGEGSSNLFYEMETPQMGEVVFNSSLGGMMQVDPEGPLAIHMAYAYKPMNQFFIGFECSTCVDPVTGDGTARIHPMVVNHHVFTTEASWTRENDRFLLSWTVDRPNDPKIPSDWGGSELRPVYIPWASYERTDSVFSVPLTWSLDYFQEIKGGSRVGGGELGGDVESSSDRYSFDDLLSVSGRVKLLQAKTRHLELMTKYAYSFKEEGSWLSGRVTYRQRELETFVGVDILGSETDPLSAEAGLFSRYRSNDRVYGGVGFVF